MKPWQRTIRAGRAQEIGRLPLLVLVHTWLLVIAVNGSAGWLPPWLLKPPPLPPPQGDLLRVATVDELLGDGPGIPTQSYNHRGLAPQSVVPRERLASEKRLTTLVAAGRPHEDVPTRTTGRACASCEGSHQPEQGARSEGFEVRFHGDRKETE